MGTNLTKIANTSLALVKENAPIILTISSIGLGAGSTYMAVRVTPEAYDIYLRIMHDDKLTPQQKRIEVLKNVVPLYGPAALTFGLSAGCGVASYIISKKRLDNAYEKIAGLSTAYIFAQDRLNSYKKNVIEKFGENVDEEIQKKVTEEEAEKRKEETKDIILANGDDEEIMQDSISGQYFKCSRDRIYFICNDLQHRLEYEDMISASEYFYDAGISQAGLGDDVGWMCGDKPWPKFTDFVLPDHRPGVLVTIDTNPHFKGYKTLY